MSLALVGGLFCVESDGVMIIGGKLGCDVLVEEVDDSSWLVLDDGCTIMLVGTCSSVSESVERGSVDDVVSEVLSLFGGSVDTGVEDISVEDTSEDVVSGAIEGDGDEEAAPLPEVVAIGVGSVSFVPVD